MIIDARETTKQTKYREFTTLNAVCAFCESMKVGEHREISLVIDPIGRKVSTGTIRMCLNRFKNEIGIRTVTRIDKASGDLNIWRVG